MLVHERALDIARVLIDGEGSIGEMGFNNDPKQRKVGLYRLEERFSRNL